MICQLEFNGRKQELVHPNRYTQLFFLDEAVGLAAGHRPCGECRRSAHVERTLDDFDASKPVQERAETLKRAVEQKSIGETLNLLVLAEESLNSWQRLRLARVHGKDTRSYPPSNRAGACRC